MIQPNQICLHGNIAFVSGGASGIGAGIALGLAAFGADVAIADIDAAAGLATVARIEALGRRALLIETDLMEGEAVKASVATARDGLGLVTILINNLGGSRPVAFIDQSERSRSRHLDLNLSSMMTATHAVVRDLIGAGRGGSVINIASIEGLRAAPGFAVYSAAKAGMINFTRTLALELGEHGIRVNVIAPDIVMTDGIRNQLPPEAARRRYIPLGRDGSLDDCAGAAVFLASGLASYITGMVLNVDGGTFASSGWTRARGGGWTIFPHDLD